MGTTYQQELDDLYALIPEVKCKGLCHGQCTLIGLTLIELSRLPPVETIPLSFVQTRRVLVPVEDGSRFGHCPFLDKNKHCSQHANRPAICRAYGASEDKLMVCEYGCETVGPKLTEQETRDIMRMIEDLEKRANLT